MTFLRQLPSRKKQKAVEVFNESFKKNNQTMSANKARSRARSDVYKYISDEFSFSIRRRS